MPINPTTTYTNEVLMPLKPEGAVEDVLTFAPNLSIKAGTLLAQISGADANEVQTLNFSGTWAEADTFTISITGVDGGTYSTSALALNATPAVTNAALKTALDALLAAAGYDGATVTIGSGPAPADTTITFGGTAGNWDMPLMTVSSVTAGDGTVVIDATTAGVRNGVWGVYDDSVSTRNVAKAIAKYTFRTDYFGRVVYAAAGTSPQHGNYTLTAPAYTKGIFATEDLTGLDANAVSDLGRLAKGSTTKGVLHVN